MGNHYSEGLNKINKVLTKLKIGPYDLVAFGSHFLNMTNFDSDMDILILTDQVLSQSKKRKIHETLSRFDIDPIIMSKEAMKNMNSVHFILCAPLECIARYGKTIQGHEKLKSRLDDESFKTGMLVRALYALGKWKTLENERKKVKQLGRISMILWNLENKIPLEATFSFSHFCAYMSEVGPEIFHQDPAWEMMEKSGSVYGWLDTDLIQSLSDVELEKWAESLLLRMKTHLPLLNKLSGNYSFSRELKDYQASHPLYRGVKWRKMGSNYQLADGHFQIVLRIYAGLNKVRF